MNLSKQMLAAITWMIIFTPVSSAQKTNDPGNEGPQSGIFHNKVPAHAYDIILGRPSNHSVTASILTQDDVKGYIQYGLNPVKLEFRTATILFTKIMTEFVDISNLLPDKRYYYRFVYNTGDSGTKSSSGLFYFQTQRAPESHFTFCVQADSHLDENADTAIYKKTLANIAADSADFLIDLGDTWMTDKYRNDYKASLAQYIAQRYYFGLVCKSAPLFLTLGNHDGESGQQLRKHDPENMAAWATATRKDYYPNPFPGEFYSGNAEQEKGIGYPENYYSWEWGNALFIILDPFRYSVGNNDPWQRTLGKQQYNWLKNTLQKSRARFKFVFIHNLVGGADIKGKGRGGAEAASYFEWGGLDSSGVNAFSTRRPGWEKPIHDLLVANKVNILFHGHDHFFAKQDLGGIVYQLVPQPGSMRYENTRTASEYGYEQGKILNNPGYLRISVEETKATVEYIQSSLDQKHNNKEVRYSYTIQTEKQQP